ncbi:MAG: bifunctional methylenetetrahydrofolate dehydrogenase/methenyltetrahydrofolate cyclohydrolase FolD [Opitutaceae bacterium]
MELIDGNQIAQAITTELKQVVDGLTGRKPCIAFVRVGEDPASVSYVNKKNRTAAEIGMLTRLETFPETASAAEVFACIDRLNADPEVDGILVQAPLPPQIDDVEAFCRVDPEKDVDGFHTVNAGKLFQEDDSGFISCTPAGILELLQRSNVSLAGKHVVVIGRSLIVGKAVALLALEKKPWANATVSVCHSRTRDLPALARQADVLIAAIGRPEFVTADMVKPGAVVIDVGINRVPDPTRKRGYRLTGDVDFQKVSALASKITPVPGGVGPMTVAMLMKNTLKAFQQAQTRGSTRS